MSGILKEIKKELEEGRITSSSRMLRTCQMFDLSKSARLMTSIVRLPRKGSFGFPLQIRGLHVTNHVPQSLDVTAPTFQPLSTLRFNVGVGSAIRKLKLWTEYASTSGEGWVSEMTTTSFSGDGEAMRGREFMGRRVDLLQAGG